LKGKVESRKSQSAAAIDGGLMQQTQLKTNDLGNTGMQITRLGFGAWAIGGADWQFGWGPQSHDESIATIDRALDLGINWIDTAAAYGFGRSERVVAEAQLGYAHRDIAALFEVLGRDGSM
jgi:aryl-alcohol dehydrogenase-like predicted oxidoreductase